MRASSSFFKLLWAVTTTIKGLGLVLVVHGGRCMVSYHGSLEVRFYWEMSGGCSKEMGSHVMWEE